MKASIAKDLKSFVEALKRRDAVVCVRGAWYIQSNLEALFYDLLHGKEGRYIAEAQEFEKVFDSIERSPVRFDLSQNGASQEFDPSLYIEAARLIIRNLTPYRSVDAVRAKNRLSLKLYSFCYRLEESNGGMDTYPVQSSLVNILKRLVFKWKSDHEVIHDNEKEVNARELLQIQETSQYPEIVQLLLYDETIRESYMLWTIRDKNDAKFFIEYPALRKKLVESNLSGRIGRMGAKDLKVQKVPSVIDGVKGFEKIVTLPFDGVDLNILDEQKEVVFAGNYRMTVGDVFKIFKDKTYRVGNLEYLAHGITNWNVHHWGVWDAEAQEYSKVDLSHVQWWQQLPVFEILTQEEVFKRYGKRLDGEAWAVTATATRGSRTLDFENTHAFLEVAIPWGDGRYAIYDFGKFAFRFPSSFFEGITMFCHNLHATVAYPDENVFYSHRQTMYHAFVISPEQGVTLMDLFKKDMLKSQKKNFVYQIESENCAKWAHKILEQVVGKEDVPDMFRMHLLETEPLGPTSSIFNLIKKLPQSLQTPVMAYCHVPMGAAKETVIIENGRCVKKSLMLHHFFRTGEIYLPALLHKKKERNLLKGLEALRDMISHRIDLMRFKSGVLKNATAFSVSFIQALLSKLLRTLAKQESVILRLLSKWNSTQHRPLLLS